MMRMPVWILALALLVPSASQSSERVNHHLALDGYNPIALTRMRTGHLVLHARINDVSGRFILDTGAGRSVLETSGHDRFRLNRIEQATARATGVAGDVPLRMSHGNRLQIGNYLDYQFTAYLMPLAQVNREFLRRGQQRIDGVIGADVLRQGQAIIAYTDNMLYLKPKAGATSQLEPAPEHSQR